MDRRQDRSRWGRRDLLRFAAGAGATALLSACGQTSGSPTVAPAAGGVASTGPSPAASAAASAAPGATRAATGAAGGEVGTIVIPNTGAKLPTEKVNFRWIDSGDLKALFYKPFFEAYTKAHPNITTTYDALPWAQINTIVPLGVQNGNAHDAFALPQTVPAGQAVREGWVAPLDDIIPNFAEWKARFPFGSFIEGVHVFNGKTYTFPVTSSKRYGTLLLYNTDYLKQAGYDPAGKPFTWDEFRAAAKKLTEQGKGQYYGFIIGGKDAGQFSGIVSNLARMAGAASGGLQIVNWKTGQYNYTSDQFIAAIELLLALKSDNSIFPGSLSLNGPEARSRMPQGVAAMILEGPWNIPQWPRENANFNFEVASQPVPNSGTPTPLTYEETGANQQWVYAKSPNKAIAGDIFSYIGSEDGQVALVVASQGNLGALFPNAVARAQQSRELDPHARRAIDLFNNQVRLGPLPQVRNPDQAQLQLELKSLSPDFGAVVQGLFTGQLKDTKAAMKDLQDRSEAELERALKAAQGKGAKVSRDDWKFANWDPTRDYTEADYKAL